MLTKTDGRQEIIDFYTKSNEEGMSLLQLWERGNAAGDCITPSTFSPEYRAWIASLILSERRDGGPLHVLSLGCGNAMVEADVASCGAVVLATDLCEAAVDLARAKGLMAEVADIMTFAPDMAYDVVYMDGLLGHLYDPAAGVAPALSRARSFLRPGGCIVVSNDAPPVGDSARSAPGVTNFSWLSADYMCGESVRAGFTSVQVHTFVYDRPISGPRSRAILVARAEGSC